MSLHEHLFPSFYQKWKVLFAISQLLASHFCHFKVHIRCDWASLIMSFGDFVFIMNYFDVRVVFTFIMQITCVYSFCHKICSRRLSFMIPSAKYSSMLVFEQYQHSSAVTKIIQWRMYSATIWCHCDTESPKIHFHVLQFLTVRFSWFKVYNSC